MTRTNHPAPHAAKPQGGVPTPEEAPHEAHEPHPEDFRLPEPMVLSEKTFAKHMSRVETLGRRTGLRVHVSQAEGALAEGDIYLFNHFTRFETVVAPYILHRETGKLVRSVAYAGLFEVNDTLSRIIQEAGAVPTNLPRMLPFLAEEILRGRKVIIFPEGGLVKDKSVLDAHGNLKMWSGTAEKVRKPHRGAAVLALMLDLAKRKIRAQFEAEDTVSIAEWCRKLDLSREELQLAVQKPTRIVPSNITFYPMRTNPNLLVKNLERFYGPAGPRTRDELTIEGNLLLRPTDMDVRFGAPIGALDDTKRIQTAVLDHTLAATRSMDDIFALKDTVNGLLDTYVTRFITKRIDKIREEYSRRIYLGVTININHLVATLVRALTERGQWEMKKDDFHKVLYVALKQLQQRNDVHLHMTLARPEHYTAVRFGQARGFVGFLEACTRAKLIKPYKDVYQFSRRLHDKLDLQDIRLENPLQVHVNESEPIGALREVVEQVLRRVEAISEEEIATLRFDDMVRAHAGQRYRYSKRAPHTLMSPDNAHMGRPYLLMPEGMGKRRHKTGIVLVHGFATTPGELRTYADHLRELGHVVLGVRLPGHGTSPLGLEEVTRADWLGAVRDAYEIVATFTDEVVLVGFSTGGALSLTLAQEKLPKLARVVSIAAPLLVQDGNMNLLPVGMVLRAILERIPGLRDFLRFYPYQHDSSAAVYTKVPVKALNELRLLIEEMRVALPRVSAPVLVLQGLLDHTVKPASAALIHKLLGSRDKHLRWIAGGPHGLVTLNYGQTWEILDAYIAGEDVTGPLTGNARGGEHKIKAEPLGGKNKANLRQIIRKFA